MKRLWALMLAFALAVCCVPVSYATQVDSAPLTTASSARNGMVRVFLSSMGNVSTLNVTVSGSYTAEGAAKVTLSSGDTVNVHFDRTTGQIQMTARGVTYDMGREMNLRRHQTSGQSGLKIAQAKMPENLYPGDLQLKAQMTGGAYRLYPVVHVYIEYYLHGVVPYEMGNSANIEALKAQAVAARTYTLNKMNTRASALYDVVDTTNDQVYYGNSDTTTRCTEAVNATKGIVLMNGNQLTGTYYTASNGGQTDSAANVWGSSGYGYLTVKDDPFDLMNSASVVRKVTVYADNNASGQKPALKNLLQSKAVSVLKSMGYGVSDVSVARIDSMTPHTPKYGSPSRLYTKLDFGVTASVGGQTVNLTLTFDIFSELESALGMSINTVQNELWSVEKSGGNFLLQARRFGHGIGMSQRGAMQMGALGYTYDQILGFYYEDCKRVQHTFTHTILSAVENGGQDTIITEEKPAEITPSSGATAIVKLVGVKDQLAVRSAASDSGAILTSVINGGLVNVLARMDAWTMIRLGSIVGYVPTSALKFTGAVPEATDATPTQITQWATVTSSGTLNLRASGSMSASVITTIPSGSVLCVFMVQNGWAQVQYGASTGWASTDFLKMSSSYPGEISGQIAGAAAVTIPSGSGTVNLRETASTSARVLATLSNGTQVTVTSSDGSWCSVTAANGTKGYIMASFLTWGGSADAPSVETPPPAPELGAGEVEAVVHTASTSLNLRKEPSTQSAVLAVLPRGESVIVTSRGDEWCAVRLGDLRGYAATQYLKFPGDDVTQEETIIGRATVNTASGSLNMRKQPALGSSVLMQIPRGAKVDLLQRLDGWYKVSYAGINGYASASYLIVDGSAAPEGTGVTATVVTPSGTLNLRETPSDTARVLAAIMPGAQVSILSQGQEWCKITHDGRTGYVMTKFLSIGAAKPDEPSAGQVTVQTGNGGLNLREQADANARVLLIIPDGAVLEKLSVAGAWTQVRYDGRTGYVMNKFLAGGSDEPTAAETATVSTGGGTLNLRQAASDQAKVLTTIPDGATVTVTGRSGDWTQLRYGTEQGYVMTKFLSFGQSGTATNGKTGWIITNITGGVNLRYMPDSSGQVLAVLAPGTEVSVTLDGQEWSVVRFGDQAGYVMSKFITYTKPAQTETAPQTYIRYVNAPASGLNLRQTPSASGGLILTIPHGAEVTVLADAGNGWRHVRYNGSEGYVSGDYLTSGAPNNTGDQVPAQQPVYDKTLYSISGWEAIVAPSSGNVNLRAWCSTDAPVRLAVAKGEVVRLIEFGDEWCHVAYGEVEGYCKTEFLTLRATE